MSRIYNKEKTMLRINHLIEKGYTCDIETGYVFNNRGKRLISTTSKGIPIISVHGLNTFSASYFIWYIAYGELPEYQIYSKNGDRSDISINNLDCYKDENDYSNKIEIDISNKELMREIKRMIRLVPNSSQIINSEDFKTIANDVYLKIINMINKGKINPIFKEIKGYIFITVRNQVFLYFNRLDKKKVNQNFDDEILENTHLISTEDEDDIFIKMLDHLMEYKTIWHDLLKYKLDGYDNDYISKQLFNGNIGILNHNRQSMYRYLRKNIQEILK